MNRRKFLTGLASLVVPVPKVVKLPMSSMYGVRAIDYVSAYPYNIGRGAGSTAMRYMKTDVALMLAMNSIYGKTGFDAVTKVYGIDIKSTR